LLLKSLAGSGEEGDLLDELFHRGECGRILVGRSVIISDCRGIGVGRVRVLSVVVHDGGRCR
jgi:hypothetical protein